MNTPGSSTKSKPAASPRSWLIWVPVILVVFVAGVFFGNSIAVEHHDTAAASSTNLRGMTNNVIPAHKQPYLVHSAFEPFKNPGTGDMNQVRNSGGGLTTFTNVAPPGPVETHHTQTHGGFVHKTSSTDGSSLLNRIEETMHKITTSMDTLTPTEEHSPKEPVMVKHNLEPEAAAAAVEIKSSDHEKTLPMTDHDGVAALESASHSLHPSDAFLSNSFHASSLSYMTVPTPMDSSNIIFTAWVYLNQDEGADNEMRTIVSNKKAGCDNHQEQYGFALYVNAWQSNDHKLYVEYGSPDSGCHKLGTTTKTLENKQWYHIALVLQERTSLLLVNGVIQAKSVEGHMPAHSVQTSNSLSIGRYNNGDFALHGNISHIAIAHFPQEISREDELVHIVKQSMDVASGGDGSEVLKVNGLVAYYPLTDANGKNPKASNMASTVTGAGPPGTYKYPPKHVLGNQRKFGLKVPLLTGLEERGDFVISSDITQASDAEGRKRADIIRQRMKDVWSSYRQFSWGRDELKPISKRGTDNWGGMGVTLVDTLDTLWIMGLRVEFEEARKWVQNTLSFSHAHTVSVFETTIRELGGLLAAFDLSGEKVFLDKAKVLGDKLSPAFRTSSGIAYGMVDMQTGRASGGWSGSSAILSEFGSLQLEFRNLAMFTNEHKYEDMSMKGMQFMHQKKNSHGGLYPIKVDINSGGFTDRTITFGALGDSFYEYLLKVWIQGGKQETWLREMYDNAMDGVMRDLLAVSDPSGLVFVADLNGQQQHRKMDHLVCFLPGVLALGAHTDPKGKDSTRAQRDMEVAKSLMYTCREMYHRQKSGIAPEFVEFPRGKDMEVAGQAPFYILRPETVESLFVLHQLTGDPIYRDWSWEIFQAIDQHCRLPNGYGALRDVRRPEKGVDDRMESFWTAETMKYLYMAQDPDHPIDLDRYVLNTEAHPTKIFDATHKPVPGVHQ